MKKSKLLLLLLLVYLPYANAQTGFPESWVGNWKGILLWYKSPGNTPDSVAMQLRIHPSDSVNKYNWQIIYGDSSIDNRPYSLVARDISKGHWVIDEHDGIFLDQYWIANKLSGAFTVASSTIVNTYWKENEKLVVEFYTLSSKPVSSSGKDKDNNPVVDSYRVKSYQRAVLTRK